MTSDRRFSLSQLQSASRVPARQIRELVRLAILPAPSSKGRGATYGPEHLDRLRAWKRLRREAPAGTTNDQLRTLLDRLQDSGLLRAVGEGTIPFALIDDQKDEATIGMSEQFVAKLSRPLASPAALFERAEPVSQGERINQPALDYIRSIQVGAAAPARVAMSSKDSTTRLELGLRESERSAARLPLERLTLALDSYVATHAADVRVNPTKSETWQRVVVGRNLEIAARGPLTPDEIKLLETVGQLLQQAIYRKETSNA